MRTRPILLAALAVLCLDPSARAHELWFQPPRAADPSVVRLTFGDTPAAADAERVAEIATARAWADGKPLDVVRQPDGLDVRLPEGRPALLSAFADRGVIDYMGDTFIIFLAAYAQSRPIPAAVAEPALGLDSDQLRLLLVTAADGAPIVRATWRGKPVSDLTVQVFRRPGETPLTVELNGRGEMPCPSLKDGPVSLLAVVMDRSPGRRDARDYSHVRYKATLALEPGAAAHGPSTHATGVPARLSPLEVIARVLDDHGHVGPWAVVGYRMGQRGLEMLRLPRHSKSLLVVHHTPLEFKFTCAADGLMAVTGATPGKMNIRLEECPLSELRSVVTDRSTGRVLTFRILPERAKELAGVTPPQLDAMSRRFAELPDEAIFTVVETRTKPTLDRSTESILP